MLKNKSSIPIILVLSLPIIGATIAFASSINPLFALAIGAAIAGILLFYVLLQDTSIGVLLITFLLPFEQIGGIHIAGMNVRLSQIVFLLTFAAWLIKGLYQRNLKFKIDLKLVFLFIFVIVSTLSLQHTINMFRSIQIFAFVVFTFLVYFFMSSYEFTTELVEKLLRVLFLSMALTCLLGLFQFAGDMVGLPTSITGLEEGYTKAIFGFPRIQSTANEPLNFANYLVLPLSLAFSFFASKKLSVNENKKYNLKGDSLPILLLGTVVLVLTFSRGGWGAIALSFVIMGLIYFRQLITIKNISLALGIAVLSITGIFVIADITNAPFTLDAVLDRINISDFSAQERVRTTNEGLKGWKRHKLVGIGLGAYGPYVAKYTNIEPENGWQTVNNEYAELLIETGILGLATIVLFWVAILKRGFTLFQRLSPFKSAILLGLTAALAGMLLQYISFSTLYVFHIWFLIGLINNSFWDENN